MTAHLLVEAAHQERLGALDTILGGETDNVVEKDGLASIVTGR